MSRIRVFPFSPKLQRTTAACAVSAAPSTVSQRRDWAAYCVVTHMTPWKFVTRNTQQTLWLSSGVSSHFFSCMKPFWDTIWVCVFCWPCRAWVDVACRPASCCQPHLSKLTGTTPWHYNIYTMQQPAHKYTNNKHDKAGFLVKSELTPFMLSTTV